MKKATMTFDALKPIASERGVAINSRVISALKKRGAPIQADGRFIPENMGAWMIARVLGNV